MKILLNNIGKKYNKQWIFHNLSYTFNTGESYAILGNNGSGKSTLLQCIIGAIQLSKGSIDYEAVAPQLAFQQFSFTAPYLDLVEEMTLQEHFDFHQKFKPFIPTINATTVIETIGLQNSLHKQIGNYSSGMKQRVKLGLAFFSQSNVICLDEPLSNLDAAGYDLYSNLILKHRYNRTLIISSNDEDEYRYCTHHLKIADYK